MVTERMTEHRLIEVSRRRWLHIIVVQSDLSTLPSNSRRLIMLASRVASASCIVNRALALADVVVVVSFLQCACIRQL